MLNLFPANRTTTILAGAGCSAPPPTSLPGWWAVNDAILEALGDAVERTTGRSGLSGDFRGVVIQRRDTTPFLKPDLQAQLIEDEIGDAYFRALAHLDSILDNPGHRLIAELAHQGRVGAIITTNFDCVIERALDSAGVSYRLYSSPEDFEALADQPELMVVKVHGSSTRPSTMVDTLRQRLHGRPEALNQWMLRRFIRCPTITMGFSGEDLQYDQDYLSIRPSLRSKAKFAFLIRNNAPSIPLKNLLLDFPEQVRLLHGELPAWLFGIAENENISHAVLLPLHTAEQVEASRSRAKESLKEALAGWASSLNRMEVINAVTALLSSAGQRHAADHLLRRTWSFYREPEDCSGEAYARYLYNYGQALMRRARFLNPHDREEDFARWKAAADQDPSQFFSRAVEFGGSEDASARAVLCLFLAGSRISHLGPQIRFLFERLKSLSNASGFLSLGLIDTAFSLAEVLELCALGKAGTGLLEDSYRSAAWLGDEFRRAQAAWRLARNLSFGLSSENANAERIAGLAHECSAIADRLNIRESDAGASLARSIAAGVRSDWPMAAREARRAEDIYAELEDRLGVCFAKRERVRALIGQGTSSGHADGLQFDELSAWLQRFASENAPGLIPIIKLELASLALYFDDALATELAMDAAQCADLQEHPYIGNRARDLLQSLAGPQSQGPYDSAK